MKTDIHLTKQDLIRIMKEKSEKEIPKNAAYKVREICAEVKLLDGTKHDFEAVIMTITVG